MLRIFRFTLVALTASAVLLGCDAATAPGGAPPAAGALDEIRVAQAVNVTPEEVAETLALGGDYTDLQRDLLRERLVGGVVEWTLKVYDIAYRDGTYEVVSQPFDVRSADAVNLLRASLRVYPQRDRDHEVLRGAKTNVAIRVRGRVRSITLRTLVVVDPAVLAAPTQ